MKLKEPETPPQPKDLPIDKLREIIAILEPLSREDRQRLIQTVKVFYNIYVPINDD